MVGVRGVSENRGDGRLRLFALQLRRDALGLLEQVVAVGRANHGEHVGGNTRLAGRVGDPCRVVALSLQTVGPRGRLCELLLELVGLAELGFLESCKLVGRVLVGLGLALPLAGVLLQLVVLGLPVDLSGLALAVRLGLVHSGRAVLVGHADLLTAPFGAVARRRSACGVRMDMKKAARRRP